MKLKWDYTPLAASYDKRPDYSDFALSAMVKVMALPENNLVADVGAGTGKLTLPLLKRGLNVVAVEPNDAMRSYGEQNTRDRNVKWRIGTGEKTGLLDNAVDAFCMGSSFNVVDQYLCLEEANRVLKSGGWFVCMWNHRDLQDPHQKKIEEIIKGYIPNYNYGQRRKDPSTKIVLSSFFCDPLALSHSFSVELSKKDIVEAWHSHATLQKQAGDDFARIIEDIEQSLVGQDQVKVPYSTKIWMAKKF